MKTNKITDFLDSLKRYAFWKKDENWKIIALCFLGATIFWFFNALNKEYVTVIRYPIEFRYDNTNNIVVEELPDEVRVDARGGGWDLLKKTFWFNVDPIVVPLENPVSQKYITSQMLKPIMVEQVSGISINEVLVDTLRIDIENKISQTVGVTVDSASIRLAPNYRIISPVRLSSDTIRLTGPESHITALGKIITLNLKKELINEDFEEEINLGSYFPPKVVAEPSQIRVTFEVSEFVMVDKELTVEPVNFPEQSNISLSDSIVVANMTVSRADLEKLGLGNFRIVADYNTLIPADSAVLARIVEYPEFVSDISLLSDTLKVRYEP